MSLHSSWLLSGLLALSGVVLVAHDQIMPGEQAALSEASATTPASEPALSEPSGSPTSDLGELSSEEGGLESQASVPFPEGASIFPRGQGFRFKCISGSDSYSIQVRSRGVQLAASPYRKPILRENQPGVCFISFAPKMIIGKPATGVVLPFSNSGFPVDVDISWRAVGSNGVATEWVNFRTSSLVYETFELSQGLFQFSSPDWEVFGGALSISAATPNSFAFVQIPVWPTPRLDEEQRHTSQNHLTSIRFSTSCPQPKCEVGVIGRMSLPAPDENSPSRWFEVTVENDSTAYLSYREKVAKTGAPSVKVLKRFGWDPLHDPHTIRIREELGMFEIEIDGAPRECINVPESTTGHILGSHSGIRWQSLDDDNGVNDLRVDWVLVQVAPPSTRDCKLPLPPLP